KREVHAMTSVSILFARADDRVEAKPAPAFFVDLNLDQIVDAVTKDWADCNLKPFFHTPLKRIDAIQYRHEVFQDLENPTLLEQVRSFARRMGEVRQILILTSKLYYQHHKEGWFLQAVNSIATPSSASQLSYRLCRSSRGGCSHFANIWRTMLQTPASPRLSGNERARS